MKYAKIRSKVLTEALKDHKKFGVLDMYLNTFHKEGDCLISDVTEENGETRIGLKDAIFDYFFNERESKELWSLAEKLIGKRRIDMKIINVVVL